MKIYKFIKLSNIRKIFVKKTLTKRTNFLNIQIQLIFLFYLKKQSTFQNNKKAEYKSKKVISSNKDKQ